jgi:hypothetical protein
MSDLNFAVLHPSITAEYRPADSVYEFLSARTLDTTVPPY